LIPNAYIKLIESLRLFLSEKSIVILRLIL